MLYCDGSLRFMPDHYWIDRHRGVVSMTECCTAIQAVAAAAGKQVRSAYGLRQRRLP